MNFKKVILALIMALLIVMMCGTAAFAETIDPVTGEAIPESENVENAPATQDPIAESVADSPQVSVKPVASATQSKEELSKMSLEFIFDKSLAGMIIEVRAREDWKEQVTIDDEGLARISVPGGDEGTISFVMMNNEPLEPKAIESAMPTESPKGQKEYQEQDSKKTGVTMTKQGIFILIVMAGIIIYFVTRKMRSQKPKDAPPQETEQTNKIVNASYDDEEELSIDDYEEGEQAIAKRPMAGKIKQLFTKERDASSTEMKEGNQASKRMLLKISKKDQANIDFSEAEPIVPIILADDDMLFEEEETEAEGDEGDKGEEEPIQAGKEYPNTDARVRELYCLAKKKAVALGFNVDEEKNGDKVRKATISHSVLTGAAPDQAGIILNFEGESKKEVMVIRLENFIAFLESIERRDLSLDRQSLLFHVKRVKGMRLNKRPGMKGRDTYAFWF